MADRVTIEDFQYLDIRAAKILTAEPLVKARKPAYALTLDCGEELGIKRSSAQITGAYTPEELPGAFVLAVVNLPPRNIAGYESEVLTLGVYTAAGEGPVALIRPDALPTLKPGDKLG